jgi:hypothetical protein
MKGLTEQSIAQIDDVDKLRYLLSGVIQKNAKQLKRLRVTQRLLKSSKSTLERLGESYSSLKVESEADRLYKFERDFDHIRGDYNESIFAELFKTISSEKFENSDYFRSEVEKHRAQFRKIQLPRMTELRAQISARNAEILKHKRKIDELNAELEAQLAAPVSKIVEKALADKDQSILKLRAMIQRYEKSEETKQQQIDDQSHEIRRLATALEEGRRRLVSTGEVESLRRQIADLQSQISNSEASRQLEAKCENLNVLLEQSNRKYSDLRERYERLEQNLNPPVPKLSLDISEKVEKITRQQKRGRIARDPQDGMMTSLKQTMLQYFLADVQNQEALVPVILELVGCTQDQIQAAIHKVKSNQQFVNRATSIFSFFS